VARRTYEGTGTLPGLDDTGSSGRSIRTGERGTSRSRLSANSARSPRISTARIVAGGVIAVVCLVLALYGFHRLEQFLIVDPRFDLNGDDPAAGSAGVEIAGAAHASQSAIQAVFAEDQGRSVYLLPISDRRTTLSTVDWVKDASVARIWPNRVLVTVDERKPVAFVMLGGSRYGLIDEDGVILPPAQDRFALPVLAGVRASNSLSERRDRVHRMLRVTSELGDLGREISEIDVSDRDNIKASQPYHGRVLTLLLGDHNFNVRYRNFVNHYAEIQRRLPGAATLDLRLEDRITVVE
jgi:cell division protein FtsQ